MTASPAVAALVRAYQPFYQLPQDGMIGWGHVIIGEYELRDYANGIDTTEAERLLAMNIDTADRVFSELLAPTRRTLLQHQYDALVSLFMDAEYFHSSFLLKYAIHQNDDAVAREFNKWGILIKGGSTADRRAAESRLYLTGNFNE